MGCKPAAHLLLILPEEHVVFLLETYCRLLLMAGINNRIVG